MNDWREKAVRLTQLVLGLDGLLHIAEVISAIIEEAWTTAFLTSVHALFFFIGIYFIGHDHSHHHSE